MRRKVLATGDSVLVSRLNSFPDSLADMGSRLRV